MYRRRRRGCSSHCSQRHRRRRRPIGWRPRWRRAHRRRISLCRWRLAWPCHWGGQGDQMHGRCRWQHAPLRACLAIRVQRAPSRAWALQAPIPLPWLPYLSCPPASRTCPRAPPPPRPLPCSPLLGRLRRPGRQATRPRSLMPQSGRSGPSRCPTHTPRRQRLRQTHMGDASASCRPAGAVSAMKQRRHHI